MTRGRRRRPLSIKTIYLLIHGIAWLVTMAVVTVVTDSHVPPSELWTALPLGLSAILVAFRTDGTGHSPPHRHERREDE